MIKEWENEPNYLEWDYEDMHCVIKRSPEFGHFCGYVGVNKLHPLYDITYTDLDVHGGITYHDKDDDKRRNFFYFGFDCAHYGDFVPYMPQISSMPEYGQTYKNIDFVKNEIKNLAHQLYYHHYLMKELLKEE